MSRGKSCLIGIGTALVAYGVFGGIDTATERVVTSACASPAAHPFSFVVAVGLGLLVTLTAGAEMFK